MTWLKRRIPAAVLGLVLTVALFSSALTALAASQISVYVDDVWLEMDVPPVIRNDRTLVPIRAISEAVGCQVDWFAEDQRIVVYSPAGGDPLLVMTLNNYVVTVNSYNGNTGTVGGHNVTLDVAPTLVNGRTMVPLRFVAETIGFDVFWDESSSSVYLYSAMYE